MPLHAALARMWPQAILHKSEEEAEKEFKWWLDMFGDDYYIELQRHNIAEQQKINATLVKFSKKYNVCLPLLLTTAITPTRKIIMRTTFCFCINTGEKQSTPGLDDFVNDDALIKNRRFKFPNNEFYFKSTG